MTHAVPHGLAGTARRTALSKHRDRIVARFLPLVPTPARPTPRPCAAWIAATDCLGVVLSPSPRAHLPPRSPAPPNVRVPIAVVRPHPRTPAATGLPPTGPEDSGAGTSEDEEVLSVSSAELSGGGFSTDVSDRARERAQEFGNMGVWDTDYSTDVSDSRKRKGRRVIKTS